MLFKQSRLQVENQMHCICETLLLLLSSSVVDTYQENAVLSALYGHGRITTIDDQLILGISHE